MFLRLSVVVDEGESCVRPSVVFDGGGGARGVLRQSVAVNEGESFERLTVVAVNEGESFERLTVVAVNEGESFVRLLLPLMKRRVV